MDWQMICGALFALAALGLALLNERVKQCKAQRETLKAPTKDCERFNLTSKEVMR